MVLDSVISKINRNEEGLDDFILESLKLMRRLLWEQGEIKLAEMVKVIAMVLLEKKSSILNSI